MSTIESVLTKTACSRRPRRVRPGERRSGATLQGAVCEGRARLRGVLGPPRPRARALVQALYQGARRVECTVLKVVSRRRVERLVQLPRPPPRDPQPDKVAIVFEADDGKVTRVTYRQLHARVCKLANALKSLGINKGDRVLVYLPMSIEAVVAMQACARIGATHSVVFGGFSAKSVQERIVDAGAVAVITADGQMRGGKEIPLKAGRSTTRSRWAAPRTVKQRHRLPAQRHRR